MRNIFTALFCALALATGAQNKPFIKAFSTEKFIFGKMSDNGHWVTHYQEVEADKSPQLINLDTYVATDLQSASDIALHGYAVPIDVTDDGNIVAGSYDGVPAYYNVSTKTWTKLSKQAGCIFAITPDGRYAVGATNNGGTSPEGEQLVWYTEEYPKMWDLTTGAEVALSPLPTVDPKGNQALMTRFTDISPDGRYLIGSVFVDYPDYAFVLDRQEGKFIYVGYRATDTSLKKFVSTIPDLHFLSPRALSTNGKWLVCNGYFTSGDEFYAPVRYNLETAETTAYSTGADDQNMYANVIDNEGNIYAGSPAGSPIREFYIRSGSYWYALRSVLTQRYGMDFNAVSGLDNTGTPYSVSSDGMVFTAMVDPQFGQNMVLKMNERLVDVCNGLNLLGIYTISPTPGTTFSQLSQIKVSFDRDIEVIGEQTAARFGDYSSLAGNGLFIDPTDSRTLIVAFRNRTLEGGKEYAFSLPAGVVCVKGDRQRVNEEITARFTGRSDKPVSVISVYPAQNSTIAKLDFSTSPILLTMDCNVIVSDAVKAYLELADGQKVCDLQVAYKDNSVALFPSTTQYLYQGEQYNAVLKAGYITDLTGGGKMTEDFKVSYFGSYERGGDEQAGVIFSDDFSNASSSLAHWLLYDGDRLSPDEMMSSLGFDNANTPWNFSIKESDASTNTCAASHSCYNPAGQSRDWMLTPHLFIPDNLASLTFKAQSYRASCEDVLQVYVWAYDKELSSFGVNEYNRLKADGKQVISQRLTPGKSEESLEGEWQEFKVSLEEFAGKSIYIAFGNENRAQSMIFIDDVHVARQLPFIVALNTPSAVENKSSVSIAGKITIASESNIYNKVRASLLSADGKIVSELPEQTGLSLKKGDVFEFAFPNALPLVIGEANAYSIDFYLNDVKTSLSFSVNDLCFTPVKRVVLEEMTGQPCGNCPLGIIAIDYMKVIYGSQFIPISIHSYTGDPWAYNLQDYTDFLNIYAAPTGIVQRTSDIIFPMEDNGGSMQLSNGDDLWMDKVAEELLTPTTLEVSAQVKYDAQSRSFEVPMSVRSALNLSNQALNIFMVLMEDGLVARQQNYYCSSADPILGEWGQGGKYGQSIATNVIHNDVVRGCLGATYAGTGGLLPQTLEAGKEYEPTSTFGGELPATVENPDKAKVAVIIIDANTNRIINACIAHFDPKLDGIEAPEANAQTEIPVFNLQGQRVSAAYHGIVIRNGKKFVQ
ncbi:MAG: Omp28-related outer membrane protein [Bacteroidaceae bacterium]|nr:Omp28-related outer membrane protein [Bacteroidaceae bacterium]